MLSVFVAQCTLMWSGASILKVRQEMGGADASHFARETVEAEEIAGSQTTLGRQHPVCITKCSGDGRG